MSTPRTTAPTDGAASRTSAGPRAGGRLRADEPADSVPSLPPDWGAATNGGRGWAMSGSDPDGSRIALEAIRHPCPVRRTIWRTSAEPSTRAGGAEFGPGGGLAPDDGHRAVRDEGLGITARASTVRQLSTRAMSSWLSSDPAAVRVTDSGSIDAAVRPATRSRRTSLRKTMCIYALSVRGTDRADLVGPPASRGTTPTSRIERKRRVGRSRRGRSATRSRCGRWLARVRLGPDQLVGTHLLVANLATRVVDDRRWRRCHQPVTLFSRISERSPC